MSERQEVGFAPKRRTPEVLQNLRKSSEILRLDASGLLDRPQRLLDAPATQGLISGRRVLVTGSGGTIGMELSRTIAALEPAMLTLVDNSEPSLYQVDLEFAERTQPVPYRVVLGDVRDSARTERIVAEARPEIAFHAAALKHVPLVESNPSEGVLTNVGGTRNIADACRRHGVGTMVFLSSDKAVNPSNIMGASKRVGELYVLALGATDAGTHFPVVRFGNVLGSTGSVVPLFHRQLERGGPLTVTHPMVSRYFMTTHEAVELVLLAAALTPVAGVGPSPIFALDMGEPILVAELARRMVRLAGLRPDTDVEIVYTGLRPGEKLHEQLFHETEPVLPATVDRILMAVPDIVQLAQLKERLERLLALARTHDDSGVRHMLVEIVPEFVTSSDTGNSGR